MSGAAGRIIDITPPITPDLAVFPGDTPPSREVLLDMERGDHLTLSTLRTTVHLGAHADGVNHYGVGGPDIDAMPLDHFIGPCEVVHVSAEPGRRVGVTDLPETARLERPRVLLRTGSYPDPTTWSESFCGLEPELVDHLHAAGVITVGIDTPSVDAPTAKTLVAHHRFLATGMAIIEGLVLTDVTPGDYELIALPLRLVGFDASPVRAVLREG
ncbi:MAG: cyclase family protein [Phycisphaerales bacterium]